MWNQCLEASDKTPYQLHSVRPVPLTLRTGWSAPRWPLAVSQFSSPAFCNNLASEWAFAIRSSRATDHGNAIWYAPFASPISGFYQTPPHPNFKCLRQPRTISVWTFAKWTPWGNGMRLEIYVSVDLFMTIFIELNTRVIFLQMVPGIWHKIMFISPDKNWFKSILRFHFHSKNVSPPVFLAYSFNKC